MGKKIWCSKCGIPTDHKCVGMVVKKKFIGEELRKESWECQTCRTRKYTLTK